MPEAAAQREIVVPRDMHMRATRTAAKPVRRLRLPSRPKAAPGEYAAAMRAAAGWIGNHCVHRPGETAGTLVALGAALYVSLNALGFQAGRHPAPILPEPKTQALASADGTARPAPRRIPTDPPRLQAEPEPAAKDALRAASRDAQVRSASETTASVTPKPDANVAKAQRALSKLGYGPLKDDGMMGPGTKAALEKFERSAKLPVKGEASGRTLRELAAKAAAAKG